MNEEHKPPLLLEFLFGENAEAAQQGASGRLLVWARAFESWIAGRGAKYTPRNTRQDKLAWRRLLQACAKMPWELEQGDIQAHASCMETEGYTAGTIASELGLITNFYAWCCERQIDEQCAAGFNPAAGVRRPRVARYAGASLLSQGELEGLLMIARRDESALGKRDYAFLLARLHVGVPSRFIRRLQWGQLRQVELGDLGGEVQVRWRLGGTWSRFPGEVWGAIIDCLQVSGRLQGMQADDFVFVPIAVQGSKSDNTHALDWASGRCISSRTAQNNIKLYGRALGIPERRLNLESLRNTAVRLQLDAGKSIAEMQVFLDSQVAAKLTRYRLGFLPPLPVDQDLGAGEIVEIPLPNRKPVHFQPGEGLLHGYYLKSQPADAVLAVLAEEIQGIEEQISGLRLLARGLVERQIAAQGSNEAAQLADAHSRAAARLAELINFDRSLEQESEGDNRAENLLAVLDRIALRLGKEPNSEEIRAHVLGGDADLALSSRRLVEEIAAVRYSLRRVLAFALESAAAAEYVHLVEIYGKGCLRLVRLLKREGREQDRLAVFLREGIYAAMNNFAKEWWPGE